MSATASAAAVEAPPKEDAAPPEPKFEIKPQPGPQTQFSACTADIAIIGGGAFGGKSFALLMEPLGGEPDRRFIDLPQFSSVAFRRETPQLRMPGGLWDEAKKLYRKLGAHTNDGPMIAVWPSGAISKFWHLQYEDTVADWDSSQIPLIMFDQLESFEESQFFYMLSRNRDPSGTVKPWIRAACNPKPDSWLKRFLAWWIDNDTGFARPDRSGVIRWMVRLGDDIHWADTREELWDKFSNPALPADDPKQPRPMSVTFIVALIWDNKIGLANDPGYVAKLMAMPKHERERLLGDEKLGGNWNARATAGSLFRREWCRTVTKELLDVAEVEWCRGWDLAATKPNPRNPDPDWTVGVKMGRYRQTKRFVISAVLRMRDNPGQVRTAIENTAGADGVATVVRIPQDPAQAGKAQALDFIRDLAGFTVRANVASGDKVTRFSPFSVQAEAGNVDLLEGLPEEYLAALEGFPDGVHKDDADATAEAFNGLVGAITGDQVIEYFKNLGAGLPTRKPGEGIGPQTQPLAPALTRPMAGVADAIEVVKEQSAAEAARVPHVPGSLRVRAREPYASFMFGAGRRFTADENGIIDKDAQGNPLLPEDELVLVRAGCERV